MINNGTGTNGAASKLTGDISSILSQLPPVVEGLTGVKLEQLLKQIPAVKKSMTMPEAES
jgi:hypothetical protein